MGGSRFMYVSIDLGRSLPGGQRAGLGIPAERLSSSNAPAQRRRPERAERPERTDRTDRTERAGRAGPAEQPECRIGWRLIGANNRELGRSAVTFDSLDVCRAAVVQLRERIDQARVLFAMADATGTWIWRLGFGGTEVAVSGRTYQRQRECQHSLSLFLLAVPLASVNESIPHRPRLRGLQLPGPAGEGRAAGGSARGDAEGETPGLLTAATRGATGRS